MMVSQHAWCQGDLSKCKYVLPELPGSAQCRTNEELSQLHLWTYSMASPKLLCEPNPGLSSLGNIFYLIISFFQITS